MQSKPRAPDAHEPLELLQAEQELRAESAYARDGHTARTLLRQSDLRVVLIVMRAGASIDQHHTDHTGVIHVLTGHVQMRLPHAVVPVATGSLFALERDIAHAVDAVVDCAFLLTLGWHDTRS